MRRYYDRSFLGKEGNVKELYFQQPWNCPTSVNTPDVSTVNGEGKAVSELDVSVSGDMLMASETTAAGTPAALAREKQTLTQEERERLCLAHLATYRLLPLVNPLSSTNDNEADKEEEGGEGDGEGVLAVNPSSMANEEEGLSSGKEKDAEKKANKKDEKEGDENDDKKNDEELVHEMERRLVIDEQVSDPDYPLSIVLPVPSPSLSLSLSMYSNNLTYPPPYLMPYRNHGWRLLTVD